MVIVDCVVIMKKLTELQYKQTSCYKKCVKSIANKLTYARSVLYIVAPVELLAIFKLRKRQINLFKFQLQPVYKCICLHTSSS